jgi:hypothetical protein
VCFALPAQCLGNKENRIDGTSILGQSLSKNRDGFCRGCGYGCQRQTAELRKACGLSKEIVLVGLGSHFELWDAEKLAESEAKAMTENLSDIAAQFNF